MSDDGRPRNDAACRQILRTRDHYDVLAVPRGAEEATLKTAFRRRAREVHPDKNASPLAAEAFKRLQKASDILTDSVARRRYDILGDEEPSPQRSHRTYSYEYHAYPQRAAEVPPFAALIPFVAALLVTSFLFIMGGALLMEHVEGPRGPASQRQQSRQSPPEPTVLHLSRNNADAACGVTGKRLCVVLLTDPRRSFGERESKLLDKVRAESERNVKNSRGQLMKWTWATMVAGPRWLPLLPPRATFPWVAVLKPTRIGLRVSCMPVSKAGGKEKGRLSTGVPKLLQEIADGSAKFEPLKGNASALFGY